MVAGHICLDVIPAIDHPVAFTPGALLEVGAATLATGGPVSNVGLALHKLGLSVALAGKLGDDLFGKAVLEFLKESGIGLDRHMIIDQGATTSYSLVISSPGADRIFLHCPGANDTYGSEDLLSLLDQLCKGPERPRLLHFGYPPLMARMLGDGGSELERLFRGARELDLMTSLDMAMPDPSTMAGKANWKSILRKCLPYVDLFAPSLEELQFMLGKLSPERLAETCLDWGAGLVCIKMGEAGIFLRSRSARFSSEWNRVELRHPCFEVEVAGTTGSGDATIAGLILGILRGLTPLETARAACAVGACCVEAPDAVSGIKPWGEVQARLAGGWAVYEHSNIAKN
ncbi:MAG TPA: carbohydrate kinase family protein [Fimbriimonadaceae bacterium]|nr:carbohydrate kinase family protein [Fimbriimonadaceae bacterium]